MPRRENPASMGIRKIPKRIDSKEERRETTTESFNPLIIHNKMAGYQQIDGNDDLESARATAGLAASAGMSFINSHKGEALSFASEKLTSLKKAVEEGDGEEGDGAESETVPTAGGKYVVQAATPS